jgi:hypothetical protein
MATHVSDWADSLNKCCRGAKGETMAMMIVGGVLLIVDSIFCKISTVVGNLYGVGVFVSDRIPQKKKT